MSLIFFLLTPIFIWNEIYLMFNKKKLEVRYKERDIEGTTVFDLIYYFTRFLYWIWLITGLWTSQSEIFLFLLILKSLKFPFYYFNKYLYFIWKALLPAISIIFMIIAVIYYIKG